MTGPTLTEAEREALFDFTDSWLLLSDGIDIDSIDATLVGLVEAIVAARAAEAQEKVAEQIEAACCHFDRYKNQPGCCGYCETAAAIARAAQGVNDE